MTACDHFDETVDFIFKGIVSSIIPCCMSASQPMNLKWILRVISIKHVDPLNQFIMRHASSSPLIIQWRGERFEWASPTLGWDRLRYAPSHPKVRGVSELRKTVSVRVSRHVSNGPGVSECLRSVGFKHTEVSGYSFWLASDVSVSLHRRRVEVRWGVFEQEC